MTNPLNGILGSSGGGTGGSGDVVGPASSTDNAIARFDLATGKLLQNSAITVSDVAAGVVTLATTAGNALAIKNTDPAATTGASVAGDPLTITAGNAVASTDTAGAAAGGSVTIAAGAAARNASGNANGGDINLTAGAGIGTGTTGNVVLVSGSGLNWSTDTGLARSSAGLVKVTNGGAGSGSITATTCNGTTSLTAGASGASGVLNSSGFVLGSGQFIGISDSASAIAGTYDVQLARVAAGQLAVKNGANGQANNIKIATTTVNASGATSTATNLVPAGCILLGVTTRVTTAITSGDGGTSVNIGNGTDADMYGATIAFALGTTTNLASHTASALAFKSAAENVVFTCVGGTFSGGVWRVAAHYLDLTGPTS